MPDNLCKWEPEDNLFGEKCNESVLPGDADSYCILHSRRDDKNLREFIQKIEDRIKQVEEIDFSGCYFPKHFCGEYFKGRIFDKPINFGETLFSQEINFSGAKFSERASFFGAKFSQDVYFDNAIFSNISFIGTVFSHEARFSWAKFSEANFTIATFSGIADFSKARFSKAADFRGAKFSQWAYFSGATFSEEADFRGARFSQEANFLEAKFSTAYFLGTTFMDSASFTETVFSREAYFLGSEFSKAYFTGASFEKGANFSYAVFKERVLFEPSSEEAEEGLLINVRKEIIKTILGPSRYFYTRFLGETIFQDVDLSQCSFLHSDINKVDFRYCSFGNKDEKLLGFVPHRRQNVLKDEIDADSAVTPTLPSPFEGEDKGGGEETRRHKEPVGAGLAPALPGAAARAAPTGKGVREGKYEPVRRLYLELKKNFEEKKDWNTAGDFHYGEMECRRNMKEGWLRRNIFSLEAVYFWLSGYGERPKRAFVFLCIFVLFLFPLLLVGNDCWPYVSGSQSFCFWNCVWVFYDSVKDSFRLATFTTVTKIGEQIKPDTGWDNVFLVLESIIVYVQILLLALALRRKVKR